jgi:hypothetical protein
MTWENILKNKGYVAYLKSRLKSIGMGDFTDEAVGEFQRKFSEGDLNNWYWAVMNEEEWWIEPDTPEGKMILNTYNKVEKWFEKYGRD